MDSLWLYTCNTPKYTTHVCGWRKVQTITEKTLKYVFKKCFLYITKMEYIVLSIFHSVTSLSHIYLDKIYALIYNLFVIMVILLHWNWNISHISQSECS